MKVYHKALLDTAEVCIQTKITGILKIINFFREIICIANSINCITRYMYCKQLCRGHMTDFTIKNVN